MIFKVFQVLKLFSFFVGVAACVIFARGLILTSGRQSQNEISGEKNCAFKGTNEHLFSAVAILSSDITAAILGPPGNIFSPN